MIPLMAQGLRGLCQSVWEQSRAPWAVCRRTCHGWKFLVGGYYKIAQVSAFLLVLTAPLGGMAQGSVYFADENLKAAVEDALWVYDPTPSDMLSLRSFSCIKEGITDITGLEYAENLQTLWLTDNQITDISPLSGMDSMRTLVLNNNQISDVSHLTGMHNLEYLDLHENQLADVSPLAGLDKLQVLILRRDARIANQHGLSRARSMRSCIACITSSWVYDLALASVACRRASSTSRVIRS